MAPRSRKEMLEEMLAQEPADPFLHYGLAMEYVSEGNDLEAVSRFKQMFVDSPDYVPAYLQAGQALVRLKQPAEARAVFERGVALARKTGNAHAAEEMQAMLEGL